MVRVRTYVWDNPESLKFVSYYISIGMIVISLMNAVFALGNQSVLYAIINAFVLFLFLLIHLSLRKHTKVKEKLMEIKIKDGAKKRQRRRINEAPSKKGEAIIKGRTDTAIDKIT